MKSKILALIFLATAANASGQNAHKLLSDVKEVKVRNIGAIKTGGQIKGYYTFYEYDKADKKTCYLN